MICLKLASLAWSVLILSNLAFGLDVRRLCARRCMMQRGGYLCQCNAMHFAGKRNGAETSNDLDHASRETLQRVVMKQLARLVSENEDRDIFRELQNIRGQKTQDMLIKLFSSGEMEPYFGQKYTDQDVPRFSSLIGNSKSLWQTENGKLNQGNDPILENNYIDGNQIDFSGHNEHNLNMNENNDVKNKNLGNSRSVNNLMGENKNEERMSRLIDNVMTRLDDYEKNNKQPQPPFGDNVQDKSSSSRTGRYEGTHADSAEDSLISDARNRGSERAALPRDAKTLTAQSAHKRRLEEITPRESRSKLSAILPLLTSVNERNPAMAQYLPPNRG